jgi:hypothetical protein
MSAQSVEPRPLSLRVAQRLLSAVWVLVAVSAIEMWRGVLSHPRNLCRRCVSHSWCVPPDNSMQLSARSAADAGR